MSQFQNQNSEIEKIRILLGIRNSFFFDESRIRIEENPTTANNSTESPERQNLEQSRKKVYLKLEREIIYLLNQFLDRETEQRRNPN